MSPYKNPADRRAQRARKRAEPTSTDPAIVASVKRRLLERVVAGPKCCWIWTGYRNPSGYGQIGWGGRVMLAHRASYEAFVGPITKRTLDHLCNTPACVNPKHLRPATDRENILRGDSPSAKNARKTHCAHGHEFTEENTYWFRGTRMCRRCNRDKSNARSRAMGRGIAAELRTHCPHGHPYDEENTSYTKGGHRRCKTCARLAERERKARRRGNG